MPIRIPHRFIDRLTYAGQPGDIRVIILGSFNPGEPDLNAIPQIHAEDLRQLFSTPKYRRFSQVRNFYDRAPNRFWGIMDRIHNPAIYEQNGHNFKNHQGLKFFKGADRDAVHQRQLEFCRQNGIFITDIVKAIATTDLKGVYDGFSDTTVDRWASEFNTEHLASILSANENIRLLLNVKETLPTPNINRHLALLKTAVSPERCYHLPSTSGAAGNVYADLLPPWEKAIRS